METAKRFFIDVSNDSNFAEKLYATKNQEQFLKIVEEKGYTLSEVDIQQIKTIAKVIAKQEAGEVMTEDELLMVTGGFIDVMAMTQTIINGISERDVKKFIRLTENL